MMIIIIIYYYNYYLLLLLLLYMYIYIYILITTQLGFLSRVCLIGGRTCLFIGRDQPKVVLPNIFWGMWVLINSGVIINMILTSASYGSQPLGFPHDFFLPVAGMQVVVESHAWSLFLKNHWTVFKSDQLQSKSVQSVSGHYL